MESFLLQEIPLAMEFAQLADSLKIRPGSGQLLRLQSLFEEAQLIARPKAFYKIAYIQGKKENQVLIEGVSFTSRVLRVNLEKAHRIFAYLATCGEELEEWSKKYADFLDKYLADAIKEKALRVALDYLYSHIVAHFRPGKLARMNPGSLPDWPISEQGPLFNLLGEGPLAIGVRLNESFLMIPIKSVSGIWFPTEESFESCQLCPRPGCPGRRATYVPNLYEEKYSLK